MRYLITMKDGTRYTDDQHDGFLRQMAHMMSETDYPPVHEISDGTVLIRCAEIATVEKIDPCAGAI